MLFEVLNGQPIRVDGTDIMTNVRLKIHQNGQIRFKAEVCDERDHQLKPIDIFVRQYTKPDLTSVCDITASASGDNVIGKNTFLLHFKMHPLKKKIKINGNIGNKTINIGCSTSDIMLALVTLTQEFI